MPIERRASPELHCTEVDTDVDTRSTDAVTCTYAPCLALPKRTVRPSPVNGMAVALELRVAPEKVPVRLPTH